LSLPVTFSLTGVGSGGYAGDLTPNYLCGGDIDVYIPPPLEKPNT